MKQDIHPNNYRSVIFHDTTSGERFLIDSTVETKDTDKWEDGKEYPVYRVEISSASHPFFTGKETVVDTAGRVEKFKARMAAASTKGQADLSAQAGQKPDKESTDKKEEATATAGQATPDTSGQAAEAGQATPEAGQAVKEATATAGQAEEEDKK